MMYLQHKNKNDIDHDNLVAQEMAYQMRVTEWGGERDREKETEREREKINLH